MVLFVKGSTDSTLDFTHYFCLKINKTKITEYMNIGKNDKCDDVSCFRCFGQRACIWLKVLEVHKSPHSPFLYNWVACLNGQQGLGRDSEGTSCFATPGTVGPLLHVFPSFKRSRKSKILLRNLQVVGHTYQMKYNCRSDLWVTRLQSPLSIYITPNKSL